MVVVKTYNSKSAIKAIQTQINKINKLYEQYYRSSDHIKWLLDTQDILGEIFGSDSITYQSFISISWIPAGRSFVASSLDYEKKLAQIQQEAFLTGLEKAKGILEFGISQIRRKGLLIIKQTKSKNTKSKKVFVVHGHDIQTRDELIAILKDEFNLEPIVLMDKPHQGKTMIEKFENNSLDVGYAFIILSPDDAGYSLKKVELPKHRARENVILELGYFIGKLGRDKICCLRKGNTNVPSDLHGVGYVPFNEHVKEAYLDIKRELEASGLITNKRHSK